MPVSWSGPADRNLAMRKYNSTKTREWIELLKNQLYFHLNLIDYKILINVLIIRLDVERKLEEGNSSRFIIITWRCYGLNQFSFLVLLFHNDEIIDHQNRHKTKPNTLLTNHQDILHYIGNVITLWNCISHHQTNVRQSTKENVPQYLVRRVSHGDHNSATTTSCAVALLLCYSAALLM